MPSAESKSDESRSWVLSAVLLIGAIIIFCFPGRTTAVLLTLGALLASPAAPKLFGGLFKDGAIDTGKKVLQQFMSETLSNSMLGVMNHEALMEQTQNAAMKCITKAITNGEVKREMFKTIVEALRDKQLQQETLDLVTTAAMTVIQDEGVRQTLVAVAKESILDALKDEGFLEEMVETMKTAGLKAVSDKTAVDKYMVALKVVILEALQDPAFMEQMVRTVSNATIQASRDEDLRNTLVEVTKLAVTDALRDDEFVRTLRAALQDSLKDSNMYRAALSGVGSALNPFARGDRQT